MPVKRPNKPNRCWRAAIESLDAKQLFANIYVATTGSDSNNGALATPYASIHRAAAAAKAGDNVYVRGGTYRPTTQQWIGSRGTASARITFQPYGTEKVILDGTNLVTKPDDIVSIMGAYVDFGGFEIRNSNYIGIVLVNASNIRVHNNVVHDNANLGIAVWGANAAAWSNVLIENNTVYMNCEGLFPYNDNAGGWTQAIGVTAGTGVTVRKNFVYANYGEGIGINRVSGTVVVEDNIVRDNYSCQIYLMDQTGALVQRNFVYSINDSRFYRYGKPATGIQIATETTRAQSSRNNTVINNVMYNCRAGFYYGEYMVGGGMLGTLVANNTIVDSSQAGIWIDSGPHSGSQIVNNAISQKSTTVPPAVFVANSGVVWKSNLWHVGATVPLSAKSSTDIIGDPKFVVSASGNALNFRVQVISPAIDKGTALPQVTGDYVNTPRPQNGKTDIGAFEYKTVSPPAPIPQPVPGPTGVAFKLTDWDGWGSPARLAREWVL